MNNSNMKFSNRIILLTALAVFIFVSGCAGDGNHKKGNDTSAVQKAPPKKALIISEETNLLLNDLSENGDYVNGREFPSLIKASIVHDLLEDNIIILVATPTTHTNRGIT